jgi:hypothetical protein
MDVPEEHHQEVMNLAEAILLMRGRQLGPMLAAVDRLTARMRALR